MHSERAFVYFRIEVECLVVLLDWSGAGRRASAAGNFILIDAEPEGRGAFRQLSQAIDVPSSLNLRRQFDDETRARFYRRFWGDRARPFDRLNWGLRGRGNTKTETDNQPDFAHFELHAFSLSIVFFSLPHRLLN